MSGVAVLVINRYRVFLCHRRFSPFFDDDHLLRLRAFPQRPHEGHEQDHELEDTTRGRDVHERECRVNDGRLLPCIGICRVVREPDCVFLMRTSLLRQQPRQNQ